MKKIPFNLNDYVLVKLTPIGIQILELQHNKKYEDLGIRKNEWIPPVIDADGYTKFQLWELMRQLGGSLRIGMGQHPIETEIIILTEE